MCENSKPSIDKLPDYTNWPKQERTYKKDKDEIFEMTFMHGEGPKHDSTHEQKMADMSSRIIITSLKEMVKKFDVMIDCLNENIYKR